MRLVFLLLSIYLFLVAPAASRAATTIEVGIDSNPPLTFVNSKGKADGLFVDLLDRLAKVRGWSVNYRPCHWEQCLAQLDRGEIDLLPAIAYTDARAAKYQFSRETIVTSWGQIYQQADELHSILDLDTKSCAVLASDTYYIGPQGLRQVAANFGININFVEVNSYDQALSLLKQHKVDAAMVGRIYGNNHHQQFDVLPAPIMINPISVRPAFSRLVPQERIEAFNAQIGQWKQTPDSIYYRSLDKRLGGTTVAAPFWLRPLMYSLTAALLSLLSITLVTRRQVKAKTRQLAEKNLLLESELAERKRIEQELQRSEEQYRIFFEESHSVMLLIDPQDASIVDANPAACDFYQYDRAKLTSMKMWQINRLGEAEVYERLQKLKGRKQQRFEFDHTRSDGTTVPVEVYRSPIRIREKELLYTIVHDISQRRKAEQALEERSQFLQAVIDGVSDPLMVIDFDYQVLKMNRAARELKCAEESETGGIACYELSHASLMPCDASSHPCPLQEVRESGEPVTMVHHHESNQGQRIVELNASPLFDSSGEMYAIIEVARDITERLQIEELLNANEKRLHHLAHHDSLTNLPNRLLFDDRLKQALSKARRSMRQVALFFLDLDNFKAVNDNLGHNYGDLLLIDVAKRLRKSVREGDTVARMGGDEFLILLEDIDSIETIEATARRVCDALSHELTKDQYRQQVSASIGISIFPEDANTPQQLMKTADLAMYRAKNRGKAGYQFYSAPQGRFLF